MMGGSESVDFLAPSGSGENTLVTCENGDFAADLEVARAVPRAPELPASGSTRRTRSRRRASTTIEALAELLGIDSAATSKAMPVTKEDGTVVLALVRGDDRLESAKLVAALGRTVRPATEDEIRAAFGAEPGSLGPVGFDGEIVADETLREGQFVAGANRTGWHLRGVEAGRDFEARFADIREPTEGDRCAICGGALRFQTAIEVGHIFKLGTRYSVPLEADVPRRGRAGEAARDGQLRHRPRPRSWPPPSSSVTTRTGSAGRRRSHRTTCTSSCCLGVEEQAEEAAQHALRRGRGRAARRPRAAAPARSSPTPT